MIKKKFFYLKKEVIFQISKKRNANLCAILDMKLFNTDIIDTIADDKKFDRCLIQGWCFKKSVSTVPKIKNYMSERCLRLATQHNLFTFVSEVLRVFE